MKAESVINRISISIHAPRMGSDSTGINSAPRAPNFNPRSPHGERPGSLDRAEEAVRFQSTLPAWGATVFFMKKGV